MVQVISPNPIDDVITKLEQLIQWSLENKSRIGYFASLYLRVTNTIRSKIGTGYFDDDERMERLDAAFAGRFFTALQQFQSQSSSLPVAWAVAFNATKQDNLIIVQHLLLAMNSHINIDLAVSAAQTSPGESINCLHSDFLKISSILATIVPTVVSEIDSLSPWLHLLYDLDGADEDRIIIFSMNEARDAAWTFAQVLAYLSPSDQQKAIDAQNVIIAKLGKCIISPDWVLAGIIDIIRVEECTDIERIINTLNTRNPLYTGATATIAPVSHEQKKTLAPNRVYYFEIAAGSWAGRFTFQVKSWSQLWNASIGLKNKLLVLSMALFQKLFGNATISSKITAFPQMGQFGVAKNDFRIYKSWFTLFRSYEEYVLSPNGTAVAVIAHVRFGPIAFLFREQDMYPAGIFDNGMRATYSIKLLNGHFLGKYQVSSDRKQVHSVLENKWAKADEILNKIVVSA